MTKLNAASIVGGLVNSDRTRQTNDWYATPPLVTKSFMDYIQIDKSQKIWEPCSGDGAMLDIIKNYSNNVFASDLNPQREDIIQHDFLLGIVPDEITLDYMIITNPPFNIADKIIKQSFGLGFKKLALLLKSTYFHASSRTELFNKYRPTYVLPLNWRPDFLNKGSPTMEVSWFYWESPCSDFCKYDVLTRGS